MAYYSGKDVVDFTYNTTDLKAFVAGIDGLEENEVVDQWRALGSAYKSSKLTGQYEQSDITVTFKLDGGATGPAVKCAKGTSSTLTITLATGLSITGTFVVRSRQVQIPEEGLDQLVVVFTADGTVTWDLAA